MNHTDYNSLLDVLFKKWEAVSIANGYDGFCSDGLMYKGEIWSKEIDGKTYFGRSKGNESQMWQNAPQRVLFLNKDVPYDKNQDIREWIFRQHLTDITYPIYKNIALWMYGLLNVNADGIAPDYNTIKDTKTFSPFLDNTPFAYVNCKKEAGRTSISLQTLRRHMELFKNLIKEQLLILNPDIIVCGGGSSAIKNFVVDNIYKEAKCINNWMYFDEVNNKLIIDSYHPSYKFVTSENIYSTMMLKFKEFLDLYPRFKNSCRMAY